MLRRELLLSVAAVAATGAWAADGAPQAIRTFEAESGGHFGLYAENTQDGRRIAWRADDRFVMCSSFKASLAALILRRVDHRT
ncbi:MAG: class A beta-lactamase, partial [Caulobacteraceae bacterium]